MNTLAFQCQQWTRIALWASNFLFINVVLSPMEANPREKKPPMKAVANMIEDIANRNHPPKLLGKSGERLPLFPSNYDWEEQKRVKSAYARLTTVTDELWEELVKNANNRKYSLTVKNNTGEFAQDNWTVGDVCRALAYEKLVALCDQHLPLDPNKPGHRIYLDIGVETTNIAEWRIIRSGKPLYQLQIDVCELRLKQLAKAKGISRGEKHAARKKIESEIARLKTKKECIFLESSSLQELDVYSLEEAMKIRARFQHKK